MFFWRRVAPQIPEEGLKPTATPGYTRNFRDLNNLVSRGKSFSGYERNAMFVNQNGKGFAEVGGLFGVDFEDDARAVAVMDWDRDGDLDLWVTNRTAPQVRLLRNNHPSAESSANSFLAVRLIGNGTTTNRDAIGARLTLSSGREPQSKQIRTVRAGDGFLAQSSAWTHFGLGESRGLHNVSVAWPGGETETFRDLKPGTRYTIKQGDGQPKATVLVSTASVQTPTEPRNRLSTAAQGAGGFWVANQVPFPDLTYTDETGATRSTSDLIGKPVLINFWATWCVPCLSELRDFAKHALELRALDTTVLALNVDGLAVDRLAANGTAEDEITRSEGSVTELLSRIGYTLPHGVARQENLAKIEILVEYLSSRRASLSIPLSVLVDANGNVAAVYTEVVGWEQLRNDIALLNGTANQKLDRASPRPGRWFAAPRQSLDRTAYLTDYATLFATNGFAEESQRLYRLTGRNESSRTAQDYYNLAKSATQKRDTKQAVDFYRKAIQLDPNYGPALTGLGAVMLQGKRVPEAKKLFERALSIDPNHATALINLALIDQSQGDNESALERLWKVVARNPGYAQAQFNLGSLLAKMKEYDQAIQHLSKAIELNPNMIAARMNLAVVFTKNEQWRKAESQYERVRQLRPQFAPSYYGLGSVHARQQRHADAVAAFRKAISLGFSNAKTYVQLGLAHASLGERQAAADAFEMALKVDPGNEAARRALQESSVGAVQGRQSEKKGEK